MAYKLRQDYNNWRRKCRAKRRVHGKCIECGVPSTNRRKCKACSEKKNASERARKPERLQHRKQLGLCANCANESVIGAFYCFDCLCKVSSRYHRRKRVLCIGCPVSDQKPPVDGKTYCQACLDKANERNRELRRLVIAHYGGKCNCSCGCDDSNERHLTIDHINNDGAVHRKTKGIRGVFYRWIIKNGFPNTLQLLCWNCNLAKEKYGGCK